MNAAMASAGVLSSVCTEFCTEGARLVRSASSSDDIAFPSDATNVSTSVICEISQTSVITTSSVLLALADDVEGTTLGFAVRVTITWPRLGDVGYTARR